MRGIDEKGFSLVELIIVIAIMAVLLVVLAPQYLKYVERSRNATDLQNARSVATAIETYATDPDNHWPAADHWEFVTAFAVNDTADRPDNFHGGSYGGAKNGDTRVDDYAWYAMKDAGLLTERPVGIRTQSRHAWETWTVGYRSDGNGGILIRFAETADVIEAGGSDNFTKAMEGN